MPKSRLVNHILTPMQVKLLAKGVAHDPRLYTLKEAAEISGRNPELIRRWLASGRIAGVKDTSVYPAEWLISAAQMAAIITSPYRIEVKTTNIDDLRKKNGS